MVRALFRTAGEMVANSVSSAVWYSKVHAALRPALLRVAPCGAWLQNVVALTRRMPGDRPTWAQRSPALCKILCKFLFALAACMVKANV